MWSTLLCALGCWTITKELQNKLEAAEMNKDRYCFKPISTFVYICLIYQSHYAMQHHMTYCDLTVPEYSAPKINEVQVDFCPIINIFVFSERIQAHLNFYHLDFGIQLRLRDFVFEKGLQNYGND